MVHQYQANYVQEPKSDKILVGIDEICAYAKVGTRLFPDLIKRGFPAVKWGGKWRAHADNVEGWMQAATRPAGPQRFTEENAEEDLDGE